MIEYRNSEGELHRIDGPAVEFPKGTKMWYVNGTRHRLDGPAIKQSNGYSLWYVDGIEYSYLEYIVAVEQFNNNKEIK